MNSLKFIPRKRIAISQRVDFIKDRNEFRDSIDIKLIKWIDAIGGIAFPIPNYLDIKYGLNQWLDQVSPKAIILSGGNDIGAYKERDLTEASILEFAKLNNIPVLGICRGMQMMAVFKGSSLEPVKGHAGTSHPLVSKDVEFSQLDFICY